MFHKFFFSMEQTYMYRIAHRLNNTTRIFVHVTTLFSFINTHFPCHAYNNLTNGWLAHKIRFFYWLKQSPTPTFDIALAAAHEQWVARLTRNVEVTQHCLCLKCKKRRLTILESTWVYVNNTRHYFSIHQTFRDWHLIILILTNIYKIKLDRLPSSKICQ